jgi:hypothetical protein
MAVVALERLLRRSEIFFDVIKSLDTTKHLLLDWISDSRPLSFASATGRIQPQDVMAMALELVNVTKRTKKLITSEPRGGMRKLPSLD